MVDSNSPILERFTDAPNLLVKNLVDFVFPPRCPLCSRPIQSPEPHFLCPSCLSEATFIGPPYCIQCGIRFASEAEENHLCGRCLKATPTYGMARAICTFSGSIKTAIHAFKYQNKTYLAKTLIGLMDRGPLPFNISRYDTLVPVPLHRNRLRERGYNQSLLLARQLGHRHGVPVDQGVLKKIHDSLPQIELTGAKREENVKGVFSLGGDPAGRKILLVDDVLTTGATVNECARVLLKGGAKKIDIFTVARAV